MENNNNNKRKEDDERKDQKNAAASSLGVSHTNPKNKKKKSDTGNSVITTYSLRKLQKLGVVSCLCCISCLEPNFYLEPEDDKDTDLCCKCSDTIVMSLSTSDDHFEECHNCKEPTTFYTVVHSHTEYSCSSYNLYTCYHCAYRSVQKNSGRIIKF